MDQTTPKVIKTNTDMDRVRPGDVVIVRGRRYMLDGYSGTLTARTESWFFRSTKDGKRVELRFRRTDPEALYR